jgi:hypothetical protein
LLGVDWLRLFLFDLLIDQSLNLCYSSIQFWRECYLELFLVNELLAGVEPPDQLFFGFSRLKS